MRPTPQYRTAVALSALAAAATVVVMALVTAGTTGYDGAVVTPDEAAQFVEAHNAWRRQANVAPLRWDAGLAARAQARAEYLGLHGCVIEHGVLPADIGENLFYASPLQHEPGRPDEVGSVTGAQVVNAWAAEGDDYTAASDTCAPGRQCGHYTQVVWATTREVGCGRSVCPSRGQVWVCNYRPRGNVRTVRSPM